MDWEPSYIALFESGELTRRREALYAKLTACDTCPRTCGVNRVNGPDQQLGFCRSSELARVAQAKPHFGEEPCLSGTRGAGTVFFSNCTARCCYCQNWEISQKGLGEDWAPERLADAFLDLQRRGCHNIDLVTPTHYVAPIVHALELAIPRGFRLPLVYNTNGYDMVPTLRLLEGVIDVYLPDLKYADDWVALRYSAYGKLERDGASKPAAVHGGYWTAAREAIAEMHRQVGNLRLDDDGIAVQGLLVRHLILPNNIGGTAEVLRFLASLDPRIHVSLMSQYFPTNRATRNADLNRHITREEYLAASAALERFGITNGYFQDIEDTGASDRPPEFGTSADIYTPDWMDERWATPEAERAAVATSRK